MKYGTHAEEDLNALFMFFQN